MQQIVLWIQNIEGCPVTYEHTKSDGNKVNVVVGVVKSTDHEKEGMAHLSLDYDRLSKLGVDVGNMEVSVHTY